MSNVFTDMARARRNGHGGLVAVRSPRSPAAEAYRSLRTSLQYASLDRELKTILVTSASVGEGKTTIAANLAVALAEGGKRVVLVDCDLRRPGLHSLFGLDPAPGLTGALLDEGEPALHSTAVPGLEVLTAGEPSPNPGELVASGRMARLLAGLRNKVDMLIVDSPPVGVVADALVLAPLADGVVLVVSAGKTRREAAQRAKQQLEKVGAHLLGAVLNNAKLDRNVREYYSAGR